MDNLCSQKTIISFLFRLLLHLLNIMQSSRNKRLSTTFASFLFLIGDYHPSLKQFVFASYSESHLAAPVWHSSCGSRTLSIWSCGLWQILPDRCYFWTFMPDDDEMLTVFGVRWPPLTAWLTAVCFSGTMATPSCWKLAELVSEYVCLDACIHVCPCVHANPYTVRITWYTSRACLSTNYLLCG